MRRTVSTLAIVSTIVSITGKFIISAAHADEDNNLSTPIEVITIKSEFNPQSIIQTSASIAVIDEQIIRQRGAEHLENILNTTANIHFASGASRARFFQIRGIGERSEFVDTINPSVGIAIDGIDYSGLGTIASLYDIGQVEIFRGPQGTRFGANAMAGMINLYSNPADGDAASSAQFSIGNYQSHTLALSHGDQVSPQAAYRLAVQHNHSDGFIENTYLKRQDTNDIDETAVRLNVKLNANEHLNIDIASHYFDLDNGYDAFSLDNNRTTLSDQPGFDRQRTKSLGINSHYQGLIGADIILHTTYSQSDTAYGFDLDWAYVGMHPYGYTGIEHYFRDHQHHSLDLRSQSKPNSEAYWVAGLYRQQKNSHLNRTADYSFATIFDSELATDSLALYGQKDWLIDEQLTVTVGLRVEQQDTDYQDSINTIETINDTLWGGELSTNLQLNPDSMLYLKYSRGYKAGGVNGEAIGKAKVDGADLTSAFLVKRTTFDPETLHTLEFGVKGMNKQGTLLITASAFYAKRTDIQLKGYATEASDGNDATIFVGYIENGASGTNWGIETNVTIEWDPKLQTFIDFGYLDTKVEDFIAQDGTDMQGRDQAHAPNYQFNLGALYLINSQWYIRANLEGKDQFYYSMSHNAQSKSSKLVNLTIGYENDVWDLTLWSRNLFDHDYGVRGFSFGNDPRDDYQTNTYTQFGEPARFGATVNYRF